jgi:hypothetical protein
MRHAILFPGLLLLCGCTPSPFRPDTQDRLTSTSPQALADFFTRECIAQRTAPQIRADYPRMERLCKWWNLGDSDGRELCRDEEISDRYQWTVPAPGNEQIEVSYDWPSEGPVDCSIRVSDRLADNLRAAIPKLRVGGRGFTRVHDGVPSEGWQSDANPHLFLRLWRYDVDHKPVPPPKGTDEYAPAMVDYKLNMGEAQETSKRYGKRPWTLVYVPDTP